MTVARLEGPRVASLLPMREIACETGCVMVRSGCFDAAENFMLQLGAEVFPHPTGVRQHIKAWCSSFELIVLSEKCKLA
jgi:hypothetical protein